MGIPAFPTLEALGMGQLLARGVAERPWQCLQTGIGYENAEKEGRTEENREVGRNK